MPDVDAMLESMTALQYREWMTFLRIRKEKDSGGYGTSAAGRQRMSGDLIRAMTGYQQRRDKGKRPG